MDNSELTQPYKSKYFLPLVVTLLTVTIALAIALIYIKINSSQKDDSSETTFSLDNQKQDQQTSRPTPSYPPKKLIPNIGTAGTFNISQAQKNGSIFSKAKIDPLAPEDGNEITVTLTLKSKYEIADFGGKVQTDQGYLPIDLARVSRENNVEIWTGKYTLTQPVLYTYILQFTVNDTINNKTDYSLALRTDP